MQPGNEFERGTEVRQQATQSARPLAEKPRRFRIVKLEERVSPAISLSGDACTRTTSNMTCKML